MALFVHEIGFKSIKLVKTPVNTSKLVISGLY